jgi:hypothetical protein
MRAEFLRHKVAYSVLLIGLSLFGIAIFGAWPNREFQRWAIVGLMLFYSSWGVLTHVHSLVVTKKIVFEYVSIAIFAGGMLLWMTV